MAAPVVRRPVTWESPGVTAARDLLTFVSSAVRSPAVIGAVAPSGRALCDLLASVAPQDGSATVVELGPGTGVVSQALRRRLAPEARHVAVEIDPGMVTHLTRTRPWLEVVHGDAKDLQKLLADIGITHVDTIVSGLPWTLFSREAQRGIMEQVSRVLVPGGVFTTFAYRHVMNLPTQRRFRELLEESFDEVHVTSTVWRNVPPALCYQCRNLGADGM
jgi:phosphatidylethanolamine/phosphatidyl-N-methylethanolamine N-methyltransferase